MPELDAGRELDALIAEKVMGFRVLRETWPLGRTINPDGTSSPITRDVFMLYLGDEPVRTSDTRVTLARTATAPMQVPNYSTDIAAAWEVVEKLNNAIGWGFVVSRGGIEARWTQAATADGKSYRQATAQADTVPLAICRAALKAVGHL